MIGFAFQQTSTTSLCPQELERLEHAFDSVKKQLFDRLHDKLRTQLFLEPGEAPAAGSISKNGAGSGATSSSSSNGGGSARSAGNANGNGSSAAARRNGSGAVEAGETA